MWEAAGEPPLEQAYGSNDIVTGNWFVLFWRVRPRSHMMVLRDQVQEEAILDRQGIVPYAGKLLTHFP